MPISTEKLGERLRIARERRGLALNVAAAEIGLRGSAISLLESGKRQISTLEFTRLADLYGHPVEWFVNPDMPPEEPVPASFQAEPSLKNGTLAKQARHRIRLVSARTSLMDILGRTSIDALPRCELPEKREDRAPEEDHEERDMERQILPLALEAWRREEISQGRLLEIGRLLRIDDDGMLDLAESAGLR